MADDLRKLRGRPAYSYMRFSRPEQASGDSIRRQVAGTEELCREVGLVLDDTLRDEGISAFRGKNLAEGALGGFVRAFEVGRIPRTAVLIIESLDRLSRERVRISQQELLQLINGGLTIVTLLDRQEYSAGAIDKNPWLLFLALTVAQRAHEESATKARRLSEAWRAKRERLARGIPVRQRLPAWLRWTNEQVQVVPERVKILEWIFSQHSRGIGRRGIVAMLNERGEEPWGVGAGKAKGGWQESYMSKIFNSRAVLGEFQPRQKVDGRPKPVGEPVLGFYPQVISTELWHAAQTRSEPGPRAERGRPSEDNLFSGLVFDPLESPMHVLHSGGGCNYLITAYAFRRKDRPTFRWRQEHFRDVMIPLLAGLDWRRVFADVDYELRLRQLRAAIAELDRKISAVERKALNIAEQLSDPDIGVVVKDQLRKMSRELTTEQEQILAGVAGAKADLANAEREQRSVDSGAERIREALGKQDDPEIRMRLRREIRALIRRITLYPDGNVSGFPVNEIRATASGLLTGTRGLVAKESGRVCGAIRIEFCSGKELLFWVNFRPGDRVREPPVVLFVRGLGYSEPEWIAEAKRLGVPASS